MSCYTYDTLWGTGCLEVQDQRLRRVHLPGAHLPGDTEPIANAARDMRELAALIDDYVRGERVERYLEHDDLATALTEVGVSGFRHRALIELASVPYGATITYGQLAELVGRPGAARAAGSACANNPFPLVVPCHRVLPASGRIGAYAGLGPCFKQRLLDLERAPVTRV